MYGKTYDDQKASVVQAAVKVIQQFGFGKTTMSDIAKALRMGKSSLYHYFTSKEDIFLEVFKTEVGELREEFLKAIEAEPTPEGKLRAYILKRTEIYRRKVNQHLAFMEATTERYELLLRIHQMFDPDEVRIISQILQQGVTEGRFAIQDIPVTATVMVTAFRAFEYPLSATPQPYDTEQTLDSLLGVVFNGLLKR
ncbi:MAG TPA: TetR/AcrR family transcriptional regulator [Spirochaetia bacterium]|nr:TetR/AcrR family transcriptional regulator [Spirochaetia bacterium]